MWYMCGVCVVFMSCLCQVKAIVMLPLTGIVLIEFTFGPYIHVLVSSFLPVASLQSGKRVLCLII